MMNHEFNWNRGIVTLEHRMFSTAIKAACWLFILTVGDPDLIDAVILWIGRQ